MIHLILNPDSSIRTALHESCGKPEELHVSVEDSVWAPVSVYDHALVRYQDGTLVVDDAAVKAANNVRIKAAIAKLEAGQGRAIREAALTGDKARLQAIEDRIAYLRKELL